MKQYLSFLFYLLLMILFSTSLVAQNSKSYQFFDGTYKELRTAAKVADKPYFIYFYANWCMPCKKMNEITFRDSKVVSYINDNYMGYAVDGESKITEGKNLAEFYDIYFYPMLVIFTPEGKVVEKIDGFLTSDDIIAALKRNCLKHGEADNLTFMYDDPPLSGFIIPSGKGLYRFFYEQQESEGYGVQIGIFESYESVLKRVEELQTNFHRNIILHVDTLENKTIYRVILGTFKTRRAAMTYNEVLLMKEGYNGMIVNLVEMK
jgi:thioredoxin-related protein